MRHLLFLLFLICLGRTASSQTAIGTWQSLLSYAEALDVDELGDDVYVATENAIFVYNKVDNSIETLTKINGLSDVGIVMLKAVPEQATLIVGYENGNIDLIRDREIRNVPDVRNSTILGNKAIRHASIGPEFIYLSTGIGILAFDLDRREIRNTYRIVAAENLSINETTILSGKLYAATDQGFYSGSLADDLTIFNNWEIYLSIPQPFGIVRHCAAQGGTLFINQPAADVPGLYVLLEDGSWELTVASDNVGSLRAVNNSLVVTTFAEIQKRGSDGLSIQQNFNSYNGSQALPSRAHADAAGNLWIADRNLGLVRRTPEGEATFIAPAGPGSNRAFSLTFERDELWVASGTPVSPGLWSNQFLLNGFYQYKGSTWTNYTRANFPFLEEGSFFDIPMVYRYPGSEERLLVGSFFSGVMEMVNGQVLNHFTDENSSLTRWPDFVRPDGKGWIGVTGFVGDESGNVWMLNSRTDAPLSVYRADGTWKAFDLDRLIGRTTPSIDMLISQQGYHWIVANREGIVVFDHAGTIDDETDDRVRKFTAVEGAGGLPSNEVYCIAEDLDGVIWAGTNDGIGVFFSPFDALSDRPSDARPILVEQDGIFQPLFENEAISVITIDGANRKWVGTFGSGVFLMSADGTEQLLNFTTVNSPLISDNINDIAIDPRTGEVYIATEQGIQVYTADATAGQFSNSCTSVFPNPVRETYSGPISITGLVRDTEVRITDVRGNLVASTVSNGGTAVWDGRNLNNERVATGVYFALSSDSEGTSTCVSKILVVK